MSPQVMCQICGMELREARWRLLGVCGNSKCQLAWAGKMQARLRAEIKKKSQQGEQIAKAYQDREALRLGIDKAPRACPVAVPANLRKVMSLPERRKRAFQAFLQELVAQAAAMHVPSATPLPNVTAVDSSPTPPALEALLNRGCATCRGRCCTCGGNHAYLDVETLLNYMKRHPPLRPKQVLDAYLSLLPEKTYENSCVYHTKAGCALPRDMRSKISSDFFCEELWQFQRQFFAGEVQPVMFIAIEGNQVVRSEPFSRQMPGSSSTSFH